MTEFVSLGWQVADWIETLLCHGPGDVQGDKIELDTEFLAVVAKAYQLNPKSGRRLIRWFFLSRAKGRAKSELAGMVVCAEALGPVRFDHWAARGETAWWGYEYEEGEPVGRPVTYPFIRCLATEEGQAGNTYDNVVYMLNEGRIAQEVSGLDVGMTRTFLKSGGGEIRPCTAGAESKDGGKETFAVEDEPHLWYLPEQVRMHGTVARNLTKRKIAEPWMFSTSTMYLPGQNSVAEQAHVQARADLASGKKTVGFHMDHKQGGPVRRADSDAKLKKELALALGEAAGWSDLDAKVVEARMPVTAWADVERYFLNREPESANVGWLKDRPGAWEHCESLLDIPLGAVVAAGVDSARSRDHAGIVIASRVEGRVVVRAQRFLPGPSGTIDRAEMKALLRWLSVIYELRGVQYDPKYFEDSAQELEDDGILMLDNWQSPERMVPACGHLLELIVGGELAHDGDPVLSSHVLNAEMRMMDQGFRLSKGKSGEKKIDLAIALAMACAELDLSDPDTTSEYVSLSEVQ